MKSNLNIYRVLRLIRDLKVSELAEMLDTSAANICGIESGRHNPSRRLLRDYAKALGVTPDFITNHAPNNEDKNPQFDEYLYGVLTDVLALKNEEKKTIVS